MAKRLPIFVLACAAVLSAQTQAGRDTSTESKPSFLRRFSVALRVAGSPSDMFVNADYTTSTTNPTLTNKYATTTTSSKVGFGPSLEFRLNPKLILSADVLHRNASYTQTTTITDVNSKDLIYKEYTRASYWDVPLRLQAFGLRHMPKTMFLEAGGALRSARHIRTGNDTTYIDGTTAYNETPTSPSKKLLKGGLVGLGFRFVDDYGIKISPEIRYIHWSGATFDNYSTRSKDSQFEVLIGIGF